MSVEVRLRDVSVELGNVRVLEGVSLDIPAGKFVTLLGPSGSGKTTTLNVLAGFVRQQEGHVFVGGRCVDDVPPHRRNIGFVFQDYALFPHMTVEENVAFPLVARRVPAPERRRLVMQALEMVRLPHVARRSVRSLSGGQQQRVALARALVFSPSLLLLDEPLAALDKQLREAMQLELKRIQRESGTTAVAVTHDQVEAMSMSDIIAILNDGRLVQVGSPEEIYRHPRTLFVARFVGEANLLPVENGRVVVPFGVPVEGAPSGRLVAVVRPDDLWLEGSNGAGVPARVEGVVFQGTRRRVTIRCAGVAEPLVVSVPPWQADVAASVGEQVRVRVRRQRLPAVPVEEVPAPRDPAPVGAANK